MYVYLVSTLKVRLQLQVVLSLKKNDANEMNPVPPSQDCDGSIATLSPTRRHIDKLHPDTEQILMTHKYLSWVRFFEILTGLLL